MISLSLSPSPFYSHTCPKSSHVNALPHCRFEDGSLALNGYHRGTPPMEAISVAESNRVVSSPMGSHSLRAHSAHFPSPLVRCGSQGVVLLPSSMRFSACYLSFFIFHFLVARSSRSFEHVCNRLSRKKTFLPSHLHTGEKTTKPKKSSCRE